MNKTILLKNLANYVEDKISADKLNKNNYIGVDNILPNRGGIKTSEYFYGKGKVTAFKKGDILIGNIRPYFKKIWLATFDGGCDTDVLCIRPKEEELSSFLYSTLSTDFFFNYVVKGAKGSKMPRGDKKHIMEFPIMDISNKKVIGDFIVAINEKIANNNAISKELESMAKTIYDYWFLQFEFPDKDGKPYKSNGGKMVWNDQLKQEIPEGWEVRKLKDIIVENPKSKIKVKEAQQDHFGDIPFFTSGQSILSMDEKLVTGMNCYLNTGGNADVKYFYGPASYSTDTWSIKGKVFMEYLLPFILKNLQPSMDDKFFQGTGLRHLQKPLLKDYPILVPNEEIISKFIPLVSDVFRKVSDSYRENIELEKMRNFLLPMLMNGQVTIKD